MGRRKGEEIEKVEEEKHGGQRIEEAKTDDGKKTEGKATCGGLDEDKESSLGRRKGEETEKVEEEKHGRQRIEEEKDDDGNKKEAKAICGGSDAGCEGTAKGRKVGSGDWETSKRETNTEQVDWTQRAEGDDDGGRHVKGTTRNDEVPVFGGKVCVEGVELESHEETSGETARGERI